MVATMPRFRLSRTFLAIVGSIALLLVVGYCWGLQTMMTWQLRHQVSKIPILALTPQPLPSTTQNLAEGAKLTNAGFSFEVPWADLDSEKTRVMKNITVFAFHSGRVVSFFGPDPDHHGLLWEVEKDFGDKKGTLKQLFGLETTQSEYALHKTMLELTPSQMKPWMSRRDAFRISFLLTIKAISSVGGETGVFQVEANGWRGFQMDDPSKKPKRITLELYDSHDQHVEIIFATKKDAGADITQADINRALETLKAGESDSAAATSTQSKSKSDPRRNPS